MTNHIKYLDDENFDSNISSGVVLVDFFADWCGPCRMMEPIIEELAADMSEKAVIAKIDIEASQKVTSNLNVTSIPTIILFKDGKEQNRIVGVKDKDALTELINNVL